MTELVVPYLNGGLDINGNVMLLDVSCTALHCRLVGSLGSQEKKISTSVSVFMATAIDIFNSISLILSPSF